MTMNNNIEVGAAVSPLHRLEYQDLLLKSGISDEHDTDYTALLFDDFGLLACGSLKGNILKQIAVDQRGEGEGACAAVVSALVTHAYNEGFGKLFLFTKPQHRRLFGSMGFYPLVESGDMLFMENMKNGLSGFLATIPKKDGFTGCVVCNCNPMTYGHLFLIETAARECDRVLVFVLSEDASEFSTDVRMSFVKSCTEGIPNVEVYASREYLVSRATFPTYFLKSTIDVENSISELDLLLFAKRIAPELNIKRRYVGTEPYCAITAKYNETMKRILPKFGIEVRELDRKDGISASRVRELLHQGKVDEIRGLVPPIVYDYCKDHFN